MKRVGALITFLIFIRIYPGEAQDIAKLLSEYIYSHHAEKIYVTHDRPFYAPGEVIWCKVIHVDAISHRAFVANPIVYVDWIDRQNQVLHTYIIKIENGAGIFEIPTFKDDPPGSYKLRAYTQYQRNFNEAFIFQKEIPLITEALPDLQKTGMPSEDSILFFPEGGHMVAGLTSKVGFRVISKKEYINGKIFDQNGNFITELKSLHDNLGVFSIIPKIDQSYYAMVEFDGLEKKFRVPKPLAKGLVMTVNSRREGSITLSLAASDGLSLKNSRLIGHLRGQIFLDQEIQDVKRKSMVIDITSIPSGVVHFTLFDSHSQPVAERLVFNKSPGEQPNVQLNFSGHPELPRSLVRGEVLVLNNGDFAPAQLSLSIYNSPDDSHDTLGLNIENYILLQSDITGKIHNINQYFLRDDSKTRTLLDLLMMTFGWRKFNWIDVVREQRPDLIYPSEEDITISGRVRSGRGNRPIRAEVSLNVLNEGAFTVSKLTTDEDGLFFFKGLNFLDTTDILIQGEEFNDRKKRKLKKGEIARTGNKNVDIEILNLHDMPVNKESTIPSPKRSEKVIRVFVAEVEKIRKVDSIFHPEWSIDLDEFTVRAIRKTDRQVKNERLRDRYRESGIPYFPSSLKVYFDDLPGSGNQYVNVYDVIRARVPGADVRGDPATGERQVYFRGISSITLPTNAGIMVDGVFRNSTIISSLNPANILALDVMKGLYATAIFGEQGSGGVINIVTRNPDDRIIDRQTKIRGIINIRHPGYSQARTFSSPDYAVKSIEHQKPDYRNTLYWNGSIRTKRKPVPFSFYTDDGSDQMLIRIEGITNEGLPFVHFDKLSVGSNN